MVALAGLMTPRPGSTARAGYRPRPLIAEVCAITGVPWPALRTTSWTLAELAPGASIRIPCLARALVTVDGGADQFTEPTALAVRVPTGTCGPGNDTATSVRGAGGGPKRS